MRVVNRLVSALLGIALVGAGAWLLVNVVLAAFDRPELWSAPQGLLDARLDDNRTLLVSIGLGVLGVLILVAELIPRRPARLPATVDRGWFLRRRTVEQQIDQAATTEPSVTKARTAIRRRRGKWRTTVTVTADPAAEQAVRDTTYNVLARMAAPEGPVRVVLHRRSP